MYTRRSADNHFRCVVRVGIFSDWGDWGMFVPKRSIAASCSYKGKFIKGDRMTYVSSIIHTYTYSLVWCVYRTCRSSPLCTKLDPLSWNEHVPLLSSYSFIMIEVPHYFQICFHDIMPGFDCIRCVSVPG